MAWGTSARAPAGVFNADDGERTASARHDQDRPASATEAAVAASGLPMLQRVRKDAVTVLAVVVFLVNVAVLAYLIYYFRTECSLQYGVLPNDWTVETPPSLQTLQDQEGVTIIQRTLVYFQTNDTFSQYPDTTRSYWTPWVVTCGCDECDLEFCQGSTPVNVKYEQCNPWLEVISLATGMLVYINLAFTLVFTSALRLFPCFRGENTELKLWDYVKMIFE